MTSLALDKVLAAIQELPALPAVVLDLLASMGEENADIDTLARKISTDQALTAKVLRVANSSFYGMQRQVTTVDEAIALLGFYTVRGLAVSAALMACAAGKGHRAFCLEAFWRNSLGTAIHARLLAARVGENPSEAYIAGLMHGIGILVLATRFPLQFEAVLAEQGRSGLSMVEAERAALGLDHGEVGRALLRHWKFPDSILQALMQVDETPLHDVKTIALLVHIADAMCRTPELPHASDAAVARLNESVLHRLGLDKAALPPLSEEAVLQMETASLLLAGRGGQTASAPPLPRPGLQ